MYLSCVDWMASSLATGSADSNAMTERRAILTLFMANLFRTRVRRPCEKAAKRLYYTLYTVVDAKAETKEKVQPYSIYQRGISSTYASENNSSRASRPSAEVWRRVLASLNLVPQEALPTRADGSARPLALLFEGAVLRVATDERRGVFMIGAVRFTIC
jgi:hypothetical protein